MKKEQIDKISKKTLEDYGTGKITYEQFYNIALYIGYCIIKNNITI